MTPKVVVRIRLVHARTPYHPMYTVCAAATHTVLECSRNACGRACAARASVNGRENARGVLRGAKHRQPRSGGAAWPTRVVRGRYVSLSRAEVGTRV